MKRVKEFVCLGRWESINVSQLTRGMKCRMIPWLAAGCQWSRDDCLPSDGSGDGAGEGVDCDGGSEEGSNGEVLHQAKAKLKRHHKVRIM